MKKSQIEKVIESLEADRAVLDLAIAKLKHQQSQARTAMKYARAPKPKAVESKAASA